MQGSGVKWVRWKTEEIEGEKSEVENWEMEDSDLGESDLGKMIRNRVINLKTELNIRNHHNFLGKSVHFLLRTPPGHQLLPIVHVPITGHKTAY